eukprot:GILI01032800.1.p1 GENE.GILI01032800.1~~GILI01032800.1.p1  ORF type:complete len:124 (+),score=9.09 GILI01032800.1:72-443(+)
MSGQWGTGLLACANDTPQCIDNCICYPCQSSRQLRALQGATNEFDLKFCLISSCCPHCVAVHIRIQVVEKYGIGEGMPIAAALGCCCAFCSSCQVHRELTLRNAWPGGTLLHKQPGDYSQSMM